MNQTKKTIVSGPHILKLKVEDIPNIYFTSDLHLNHENIMKYCKGRKFKDIDEMNNVLIDNINEELSKNPNAILINCGDVVIKNVSTYDDMMDRIKAKKIYNIIGNHDVKNVLQNRDFVPYDESARIYWSTELMVLVYGDKNKFLCGFTVSHYPHCDCQFYGVFNIHGHLHTPENIDEYTGIDINTAKKLREKAFCYDVGVDANDYKPVKLIDIFTGNLKNYQLRNIDFNAWNERLKKFL